MLLLESIFVAYRNHHQIINNMNKVYHLGTCSTCQRIIKELGLQEKGFVFQDIKTEKITEEQVREMADAVGSYEALFSRKAMKYRAMGLHERQLDEHDYKQLILEEYTFLKRPVIRIGNRFFVGNSKKNVAAVRTASEE